MTGKGDYGYSDGTMVGGGTIVGVRHTWVQHDDDDDDEDVFTLAPFPEILAVLTETKFKK